MSKAPLVPCSSCSRHVRATEQACPFCSAFVSSELRARLAPTPPRQRLDRAGLFALGAAGAALSVACAGAVQPVDGSSPTDAGSDSGNVTDATDANSALDSGIDVNSIGPMYGAAPPPDAARDARHDAPIMVDAGYGGPPTDSGIQPPYGAPPPPDGGR